VRSAFNADTALGFDEYLFMHDYLSFENAYWSEIRDGVTIDQARKEAWKVLSKDTDYQKWGHPRRPNVCVDGYDDFWKWSNPMQ
jgi:hypothetical protein